MMLVAYILGAMACLAAGAGLGAWLHARPRRPSSSEPLFPVLELKQKITLYTLFNVLHDPILVVGSDGMVIFMNRAAIDQLGDQLGLECRPVLGCDGDACAQCPVRGQPSAAAPFTRILREHEYEIAATQLPHDPDGHTIFIAHDITEHRMLERHLLLNEKLVSLGQLVAGIAHEINNPLTFMATNIEVLLLVVRAFTDYQRLLNVLVAQAERQENPVLHETLLDLATWREENPAHSQFAQAEPMLLDLQSGVARIARIVRDLKDFSHQGSDEAEWTSVNEIMERTLRLAHNELKKELLLDVTLASDLPNIPCHPQSLEQVFLNLILNAIHSMAKRPERRLTIRTEYDRDDIHITIADTGCGISRAIRERIFEPFFTTKGMGVGTGLGLAIVKRIVEKHGGRLHFESEEEVGTTFVISLPRRLPIEPPAEHRPIYA